MTGRREAGAGRAAVGEHRVACGDGWILSVGLVAPPAPRAVAVAGHAMMVDRRTLDARGEGLVSALVERGIAVVWPDLRGHGGSGPLAAAGGIWSYDDLVEEDTPALYRFAAERFPGLPIVAVGHSLFGHVALAHAGRHPEARVSGYALLAANVWQPDCEPSPLRWLEKRAMMETCAALLRPRGYLPVRAFRFGSVDEAGRYFLQLVEWVRRGEWDAADGFSYRAALAGIDRPVLSIAGAGDRLLGNPASIRRFVAPLPDHRLLVAGSGGKGDPRDGALLPLPFDPDHMGLVTDRRARPVFEAVADFVLARAAC